MSFQHQPVTNGLPPQPLPTATTASFNKFMPPSTIGSIQQHLPPPTSMQQLTNQPQLYPIKQPMMHQQQQKLLVNGSSSGGASNASSRTASPALNTSFNSAHLPPNSAYLPPNSANLPSSNVATSAVATPTTAGTNIYGPSNPNVGQMATTQLNSSQNQFLASKQQQQQHLSQSEQQQLKSLTANMHAMSVTNNKTISTATTATNVGDRINQNVTTNGNQNHHVPTTYSQHQFRTGLPNPTASMTTSGPLSQQSQPISQQYNATTATTNTQMNNRQYPIASTAMPQNQFKPLIMQTQNQGPPQPQQQQQQFQPTPISTTYQNQPPMYPNNNQPLPPPPTSGTGLPAHFNKRPVYQSQPPMQQQQTNFAPMQHQPQTNQMYNGQQQALSTPLHYQQQQQPQQMQQQQQYQYQDPSAGKLNVIQQGFNKFWGQETVDLMQQRHILPATRVKPPAIQLGHEFYDSVNCSSEIIRSTLTKVPDSNSLLQKSRLPFGILIHPFRDLNNLPVIQCSSIVRCRSCRTYINPFVNFVDSKKWRCNLCYRVNELPDEFQYDPVSKSYGDVTRRPEVKSSTIEFIAPSEYMLRPPQPAIYLFLLDVSMIAQQCGYLDTVCASLAEHLESLPGDARTRVGFVAYNSAVHFYSIADGFNQPHEITVVDIDDPFLPFPDNLLINLMEFKELIRDLLTQIPTRFANTYDTNSALGAALQISYKLMHQYGGRVTVFQTCLPNIGPGSLQPRENPNDRSAKDVQHLGPATDFYKRLALECSGQQIAVDIFLLNSQYSDLATLSGISKFSGGCIHHFPLYAKTKPQHVELFKKSLERYFTRKIGFESVMRVRCTRGLSIHTFHGNFFVRSTDLLSLPNVNPDAGFGMQISYEENLSDIKTVCFQAALLYTSSKGERRIRVHTLCLPVCSSLTEIMNGADCQAIIGLISKMAVDRSLQSSISDARDAFINASTDVFSAYRIVQNLPQGSQGQLIAPQNLALLPLYMMALLKHVAFRTGTSTRLDDRVYAMCELKSLPLDQLMRNIYPDFYRLDELFYGCTNGGGVGSNGDNIADTNDDGDENKLTIVKPPLLQLTAEKLDSRSVFMLDNGPSILIMVGTNVPVTILQNVFGVTSTNEIPEICYDLPDTGKPENEALHTFIDSISEDKPFTALIQIIRDSSPLRSLFTEKLLEDKSESSLSYYEFLQHLRTQVK